jgi:hypothetical protein
MSYTILRGSWCEIIVLNVHTPREDKTDYTDSFYEEIERVFDKFPKYHMNILLGDFSDKLVEKIFSNQKLGTRVHTKLATDADHSGRAV